MSKKQELGITVKKDENISEWYTQVVKKADLADYAPVKGCMIIKPYGMKIWERIKKKFNKMIENEVDNAYFPLLIPESYLEKEKEIVEGFDPEVAWVENAGKDGKLEERLAIRPTSESIIAEYMSKNIRSYRDLPFRINQWANIMRWEATDTRPFLRTREFLWQEGHTAHENEEKADEEVLKRLDQYEQLYEDIMAIPVLKGRKPEHDKFPGATMTTTVECLMPDGKSIQGGTSHNLGTNFAKAFDIRYEDENQNKHLCHTASWGISTRSIGALILAHGDDKGLVLPPNISPLEVVIVPIFVGKDDEKVEKFSEKVKEKLDGFRTKIDYDKDKSPGFKFNHWELRGVPLRIEIGPNEVKEKKLTLVRRDNGEKETFKIRNIEDKVEEILEDIQYSLYSKLEDYREEHISEAGSFEEILESIDKKKGYVKSFWCGREGCEEKVKEEVHAEIVLVPLKKEKLKDEKCAICGETAEEIAFFAKNY